MLDEYIDEGVTPSGEQIMQRLQDELGMDPEFANELISVSVFCFHISMLLFLNFLSTITILDFSPLSYGRQIKPFERF